VFSINKAIRLKSVHFSKENYFHKKNIWVKTGSGGAVFHNFVYI